MNMFDPGFIEPYKPLASGHPFLALFSAMIAEAIRCNRYFMYCTETVNSCSLILYYSCHSRAFTN